MMIENQGHTVRHAHVLPFDTCVAGVAWYRDLLET